MFDYLSTLFSEPIAFFDQAIFRTLAVLIGLCCHEWGHAYVAYRCGDDTAKRAGRLTLNPLRHLDPVGTILMFFVGFGYAKPVPVNPYNFRGDRNRDDFLVSIAGITVNLILFVLFTYLAVLCSAFMWDGRFVAYNGLSKVVSYEYNAVWSVIAGSAKQDFGAVIARGWLVPFVRLFAYTALVNLNLAVFNLIPLPPLDGSRIVGAFLSSRALYTYYRYQNLFVMVMFLLLLSGAMTGPLSTAQNFFANLIFNLAQAPFRLFGAL